jgi:hypothetical protein
MGSRGHGGRYNLSELALGLVVGAAAAGMAGYLAVLQPALADARERDQQARQRLQQQVEYLRTLRGALRAEREGQAALQVQAAAEAPEPDPRPQAHREPTRHRPAADSRAPASGSTRRERATPRADDPLGDLSFEGDDPLKGLVDSDARKRLRRRR